MAVTTPSDRVDIFTVPLDAAGTPDLIQLPNTGPWKKITASVVGGLHGWTYYTYQSLSAPSKVFAPGVEYEFSHGPFPGGAILGYGQLDTGSGTLNLFCER